MNETSDVPEVPPGIGERGGAFWMRMQREMEFDPRETDLLIEVCRTLDTIDALAEAIDRDGVMLTGSQGQQVLNGAVAELRQQQAAYSRLVTQLNLDGAREIDAPLRSPRAASAATTAKRRWSRNSEVV